MCLVLLLDTRRCLHGHFSTGYAEGPYRRHGLEWHQANKKHFFPLVSLASPAYDGVMVLRSFPLVEGKPCLKPRLVGNFTSPRTSHFSCFLPMPLSPQRWTQPRPLLPATAVLKESTRLRW